MAFTRVCGYVFLLLVLSSTSHCRTLGPVEQANTSGGKSEDALIYLDLAKPFTQTVESTPGALDSARFVQVEVVSVVNPGKHSLTFDVHYQPTTTAEKIQLGSFSLFPADQPGRFIVPLQGKVKSQGSIVLSLKTPDKVDVKDSIRAGVRKMQFVNR
jgi:hypothetical protein